MKRSGEAFNCHSAVDSADDMYDAGQERGWRFIRRFAGTSRLYVLLPAGHA